MSRTRTAASARRRRPPVRVQRSSVAPTVAEPPATPVPEREPIEIPIDFGDHLEDVGIVTLWPDRLASALVTELQRVLGSPRGRAATEAEERCREEEVKQARLKAREVTNEWLRVADRDLNAWMRSLLISELFGRSLPPDAMLRVLDGATLQGHLEVFAVPSVSAHIRHILQGGAPSLRKRLKAILRRASIARGGRPMTNMRERQDVQVATAVEQGKIRLKNGFDYYNQQRKSGGYTSDRDEIACQLEDRGYTPAERKAIIGSASLTAAAVRLVAGERCLEPASVGTIASRGRAQMRRSSNQ